MKNETNFNKHLPKYTLVYQQIIFHTLQVLILSFFIFVFIIIYFKIFFFISDSRIIYQNIIVEKPLGYNLTSELIQITQNVSERMNYTKGVYDCKNFSKDLVNELKKINISAYCVIGFWGSGHEWVEVIVNNETIALESTNGQIIDSETYKNDYLIYTKGVCV